MTVSELIAKLQSCPQDARVVVYSGEDGYDDATSVKEIRIALNFSEARWRGQHQHEDDTFLNPDWNGEFENSVLVS